jgi:uncharacterized protein YbbC (DUF1343 family)
MRALDIPHVNFRSACFTPTTSKFYAETVCGLQNYITLDSFRDYESFDPVYLGVALLWSAKRLYTLAGNDSGFGNTTQGFHWLFNGANETLYDVDVLSGGPLIREAIEAGQTPAEIRAQCEQCLTEFKKRREIYILY